MVKIDEPGFLANPKKVIAEKERQMNAAVKILDFETAAILRDEIDSLTMRAEKTAKVAKKEGAKAEKERQARKFKV